MSEFGILDSSYRLIETRFLDDWVVFKAVEVETERTVRIRTPNDRLLADPQRFEAFQRAAGRLRHDVSAAPRYYPPGAFDERGYLVTTWTDLTLDGLLRERDGAHPRARFSTAGAMSRLPRSNCRRRVFPWPVDPGTPGYRKRRSDHRYPANRYQGRNAGVASIRRARGNP